MSTETEYMRMTLAQRKAYRATRAWFKPFQRRTPQPIIGEPPRLPATVRTLTACRAECGNMSNREKHHIPADTLFRVEMRDSSTHTTCTAIDDQGNPIPLIPHGYRFSLPNTATGIPPPAPVKTKLAHLEEGHGLRVLDCTPALTHKGWYVDQHQSDTTKPALILLPHGRAIAAASDPWNDDAFTLFRGEVLDFPGHDDVMKMRTYGRADRCTELLAEDYRDDNEHQQKLHDLEEARDQIKRLEKEHAAELETLRARVEERAQTVRELEEESQAENVANYPRTLARVQRALEEARRDLRIAADVLARAEAVADPAEEEREAARQLEQETARPPRFNYF